MPQFGPKVLTDRHNPIGSHTFKPRGISNGIATLVESVSGVPLADRRITIGQQRTQGGRVKTSIKIALPVVQDFVVGGVSKPTIVRTSYVDLVFNVDATSTLEERNDLCAFVEGLVQWDNNAMMLETIVDLDGIY